MNTTADTHVDSAPTVQPVQIVADPDQPNPLRGNPGLVGIPTVIAGAVGLGLITLGVLPTGATAGTIAIVMTCTTVGVLIATIWAAALGQNAAASIYAVFFGFYASYAALVLGLTNGWFGTTPDQASAVTAAWIICWLATILVLTLVTLRLPLMFTVLFGLVDIALPLLLIGTLTGDVFYTRAAGVVVVGFIAVAVYLYADAMSTETGGKSLPMGQPLVRG
jgi:succinate-acetate transporter protein